MLLYCLALFDESLICTCTCSFAGGIQHWQWLHVILLVWPDSGEVSQNSQWGCGLLEAVMRYGSTCIKHLMAV